MVQKKMGKKHKKTRFKITRIILTILLSALIISFALASGIVVAIIKTAPPLDVNAILNLNEPSILYDDKNKFMDIVVTDQQRTVIPFNEMPENLKNAFISIEDERFYKHNGIDIKRMSGALLKNIENKITKHRGLQGASTITQQLLKNTLLTPEVTLKRKIQEIYMAINLEKVLKKDQILEAYINTIYLGGKAYGVEAAAKQYFNKKTKDLSLVQCAFLAGVPQSPSIYYPFSKASKEDPSRYISRSKTVLYKMHENGYITDEELNNGIAKLNKNNLEFNPPPNTTNRLKNEWFSIPTINQVKIDLKKKFNYDDSEVEHLLMYGGLKIFTSMNKDLQDKAQDIINNSLNSYKDKYGIIQPQASTAIMDYHTGEVKVIIGGRGDQPPRSYNRAASNNFLRPPGSSIKPLTVYSAAIDSKKATAATMIEDSPVPNNIGIIYGSKNNPFNPKNSPNIYRGYVTLRKALTHSINVVAVKLEHKIGLKTGIAYGEKFGLHLDNHDKSSIAALSLGELHNGTNPLIMSAAYGVFGNNGIYTSPKLYRKVIDRDGNVLLENKVSTRKVLSPQSAYIMYDMLKEPVSAEGTGHNAQFSNMARGKTGTSSEGRNLWFCGLTPYYSAAVWIGKDNNGICNGIYSSTAATVWSKIMKVVHENLPEKTIPKPSGIVYETVCKDSGKIPINACFNDPRGNRTYSEMFIEGTLPNQSCDIHIEAQVNKLTGNLASSFTPSFLVENRVFIKRNYIPYVHLKDQQYVLPGTSDNGRSNYKKPKNKNSNSLNKKVNEPSDNTEDNTTPSDNNNNNNNDNNNNNNIDNTLPNNQTNNETNNNPN